jgi:uncharacterized protein
MQIQFDPNKAAANRKKHRVEFEEAATALLDPMALVRRDPDAPGEERYVLVGMSSQLRLLTICYTLPSEEVIRLVSARKSTQREQHQYAQGI